MLFTAVLSLLAGLLTVLAPCVLPFLPVIVGGSLSGNRRRPYVIAGSLVASLMVFTLLLKASTVLIDVDPMVWTTISGGLVIGLGLVMLFPGVWTTIATRLHLDQGSHALLDKAQHASNGIASAVFTGAALGPVFSSCSPTYAWLIASVLPASRTAGLLYLVIYCIGVAVALLAISLLGRRLLDRIKWAADPRGWFQRTIAILFILVGLLVATGVDKKAQTWVAGHLPSLSAVEHKVLPKDSADALPTGSGVGQQAPELAGITSWINSDPLTLDGLRGKVVLVDFWTYSCINCVRTQPYLNAWYDTYRDQGLEIVGVHAPEFAFEKVPSNVETAVHEAKIAYPVALDNNFTTWRAFKNQYWPAKYLIDQNGIVRQVHFGEGGYDEMENAIRELLEARGSTVGAASDDQAGAGQSPETYLGTRRVSGFQGSPRLGEGTMSYSPASDPDSSKWNLSGTWKVDGESITAVSGDATLTYRFDGREMYLVMGGTEGATVKVEVNGRIQHPGQDVADGTAIIHQHRLYRLVSLPKAAEGTLVTLHFSPGVTANAFTFGG